MAAPDQSRPRREAFIRRRFAAIASATRCSLYLATTFLATLWAAPQSRAADASFQGKVVQLLVGQPAGGGYDAYARLLAQFLPQFLPGRPAVVVQNMPGAGSIVMANYIYSEAPRDGSVIGLGGGTIATAALFGFPGAKFDSRRFSWLGSMNSEVGLTVAWHSSPVQTTADLFSRELVVGGAGATSDSVVFPGAIDKILGTRLKIIPGYAGSAEMVLAMERGEVQGIGNWHYSSILANKPTWLRDKTITPLLQLGMARIAALPDVPTVLEEAKTDDQKELLKLVFAQEAVGRPVFAPPGVAPRTLKVMQSAFARMTEDPRFLAEAKRRGVEINQPIDGAQALSVIEHVYAARPELIKKAIAVAGPAGGHASK